MRFRYKLITASILIMLVSGGFVMTSAHYSNSQASQQTIRYYKNHRRQPRHKRVSDRKYRVYSQHYLTVEHEDLNYLHSLGNRYARETNDIYENSNDTDNTIYSKWYDGNYWSFFRSHPTFKPYHIHANNQTFNTINRRVLEAHGIHNGINFNKHTQHLVDYPISKGIAG